MSRHRPTASFMALPALSARRLPRTPERFCKIWLGATALGMIDLQGLYAEPLWIGFGRRADRPPTAI
ncbi:MAG: hypothetical protein MZU84_08335 [Sphingobacterium sp.]|nr:hypothetical protein [Sphingobacterium sp.]